MTDRVVLYLALFPLVRVIASPHRIVVAFHVEAEVYHWIQLYRLEEDLGHAGVVDLMNHDIELEPVCQGIQLDLASPHTVFAHLLAVGLQRLPFVDEGKIRILVLKNVVYGLLPVGLVELLVTYKLVCDRPEQAIAITSNFHYLKILWSELLLKLVHIQSVQLSPHLVEQSALFNCPVHAVEQATLRVLSEDRNPGY